MTLADVIEQAGGPALFRKKMEGRIPERTVYSWTQKAESGRQSTLWMPWVLERALLAIKWSDELLALEASTMREEEGQ